MKPLLTFLTVAFLSLPSLSLPAHASERIAWRLHSEYARLRALVEKLEPEFEVGGYLKGRRYGDHELLWRLAVDEGDSEVIRIFRDKAGHESFDVTFHRNQAIVPGRTVIRRFVGPNPTGWRNDTIDAETREYLGSQGARRPRLDEREEEILRQWDIELFE